MATSGTYTFNPEFAELMTEAYSRLQIRGAQIQQEHIDEALRSANLLLIDFGNRGVHQYQLTQVDVALDPDQGAPQTYNLPAGTIDVWHAAIRVDGVTDIPLWPMARQSYEDIPNKDETGRPYNYTTNRNVVGTATRTITLWPVPDRADTLRLWVWRFAEDQIGIEQNAGIAKEWFDAYAAELTARLGRKYPPGTASVQELKVEAIVAFKAAQGTNRERAPLRLRVRGYVGRGYR